MGNKKGLLKSILPWLIVLMVISVAIPFFNQSESSEIRYDKFIEIVQKEKVKDVEIVPKSLVIDVSGTYSKKASNGKKEDTKFSVVIPRTETELDSLISLLDENGTKINVVNDAERNQLLNFIVSLLPYLILFGGMFFFLKMMSNTAGGNNKAFEFGNSRAKLEKNSKTHFSDVAGMDEEKEEVTIFAVNRNLKEDVVLNTDVRSFEGYRVAEHIVLESDDLKVVNAFGQENVKPKTTQQTTMDNGELTSMLHKASWNVIRLVKDSK